MSHTYPIITDHKLNMLNKMLLLGAKWREYISPENGPILRVLELYHDGKHVLLATEHGGQVTRVFMNNCTRVLERLSDG